MRFKKIDYLSDQNEFWGKFFVGSQSFSDKLFRKSILALARMSVTSLACILCGTVKTYTTFKNNSVGKGFERQGNDVRDVHAE